MLIFFFFLASCCHLGSIFCTPFPWGLTHVRTDGKLQGEFGYHARIGESGELSRLTVWTNTFLVPLADCVLKMTATISPLSHGLPTKWHQEVLPSLESGWASNCGHSDIMRLPRLDHKGWYGFCMDHWNHCSGSRCKLSKCPKTTVLWGSSV